MHNTQLLTQMRMHKTIMMASALITVSASCASAAVTVFEDLGIPIPTTYEGVVLNLETGETSNALGGAPGADVNFVLGGLGITNDADQVASTPTWQPVRVGTGNTDVIRNLAVGTIVGPDLLTSTGYGGSTNNFTTFTSGERGYVGFSLVLEDDTVAYGWVEVTLQDDNTPGVIHSWAFDDTGAPLSVAAVPEPTQSLLLAVGFMAATIRRKRGN